MEYLDYPFEVSIGSSRRPTPLAYEHLRKWIEEEKHVLPLTSVEQLTNVNQFLEQQATLYISNIIQQAISQIIGELDGGFVTIKGTKEGALHVSIQDGLESLLTGIILAAGTNLIGKVQIEGISQAKQTAKIDIAAGGTHSITAVAPTGSYHICSIIFTVSGAVTLTLRDEAAVRSGPMEFGDTDEPRGMTHNFGLCPIKCAAGKKFQITTVGDNQVSGVITYYDA